MKKTNDEKENRLEDLRLKFLRLQAQYYTATKSETKKKIKHEMEETKKELVENEIQ